MKLDKKKLLDQAAGEDRMLLARVLDRAEQAEQRNIPACTDFLSPAQRAAAEDLLRRAGIGPDRWSAWGGWTRWRHGRAGRRCRCRGCPAASVCSG